MQDLSDLTTDEQSLLLDALCCVIASDGRVSGREVAVAVQALGVIGWHPPEPDAKRIIVETCKKIHHQGIEQFAESLIASLRPYRGKLFGQLVIEAQARAIKADSQTTPREKQLAKRFSDAWSGAPPPLDSDHAAAIRGSEFVDSKGNSGKGHSTATWLAPSLLACLAAITCAGFYSDSLGRSSRRHIRIQIDRAVALWEEAQREIDHRHVPEALTLLRRYIDDPHSPEKPAAQLLLAEADIAASDSETLKALVALTDDEFAQATRTATLTDGKVTRPALKAVRIQTIKRNLPTEAKRRHDIRVAEEKRLAEVEQRRLAEVEQRRLAEVEQRRLAEVEQRRLADQVDAHDLRGVSWGDSSEAQGAEPNTIGMELIEIPAGKFLMGSPAGEKDHQDREVQVAVTLTKPFWLGKTEVTQGQFKKVMGTAPGAMKAARFEDNAASYVSWNDATAFCQKLTDLERKAGKLPAGKSYRLPTEAEWEYACRAGTKTAYSFGDDESQLGNYGWFSGNAFGAGEPYAHKVGMKKPNPWGLYDMHGNVYEWCSDWYGEKLLGGTDPVGPGGGSDRVARNNSWGADPDDCRSAKRGPCPPSFLSYGIGFRVARSQSAQ